MALEFLPPTVLRVVCGIHIRCWNFTSDMFVCACSLGRFRVLTTLDHVRQLLRIRGESSWLQFISEGSSDQPTPFLPTPRHLAACGETRNTSIACHLHDRGGFQSEGPTYNCNILQHTATSSFFREVYHDLPVDWSSTALGKELCTFAALLQTAC